MRNLKRVLSLALALVMVLGMMVITTSAADFTDAEEITNIEAVEVLSTLGIVDGVGNNEFDPNGSFTRAQAAKLIAYMLGYGKIAEKLSGEGLFTDVGVGMSNWAAGYIAFCASRGYIAGNGDGTFNPTGELTDIALGKMVLCALGADAEEEGYVNNSNWAANVTVDMLEAGLVYEVTGDVISREDACQMILNAMTKRLGGDTYIVYDDGVAGNKTYSANEFIKSYTEAVDAYFAANAMGGAASGIYVYVKESNDYLLKTVYGVSCTGTPDDFGRPATTYNHAKWDAPMVYVAEPAHTFNTAMTEKEIFAAVGAEGIQGASDKYIVMDTIYINGNVEGVADDLGNDQYDKSGVGSANETVIVAKNDRSNAAGFGNGVTVELYANWWNPNVFTMVAYNEYAAKVNSVVKADEDKGIERQVKISGVGFYETEEFEKDDVVLYTVAKNEIQSMKLADTLTGTLTKATSDGVHTIDGVDYTLSQNYGDTMTINGREAYWYVDSCGNIIMNGEGARPASWNYGYLIDYAWTSSNDGGLLGIGSHADAEKFKIITADGKKTVLDGAFDVNGVSAPAGTPNVLDMAECVGKDVIADDTNNDFVAANDTKLVRYKLNADGQITSIENVATTGTATGATGATANYTKGTATYNSKYVTDDTVVIVYKAGTPAQFAVYNGYKSVPGNVTVTSAEYFYAEKVVDGAKVPDNTTIAAVVMVVDDLPTGAVDETFVWFASTDYVEQLDTDGKTNIYTYTNVYLDGVKGELTFTSTQGSIANQLYKYTVNAKTGYATLDGNYGVLSAASATTATVKSIQSGYYVTDHSTTKVIYTNADTVYYQVDALTGAVEKVAGLPALSRDYDVEQIMATNSCANPFSVDDPATVVYFAVIAK